MTVLIIHYVALGGNHCFIIQSMETGLYFSQEKQECDSEKSRDAWKFSDRDLAKSQARIKGWEVDDNFNAEFPDYLIEQYVVN